MALRWQGVPRDVPLRNILHHLPLLGFLSAGLLEMVFKMDVTDDEPLLNADIEGLMQIAEEIR